MFASFLLGTLLATIIVMILLLVKPRRNDVPDDRREMIPLIGVTAMTVAIFLAAVTGLAVA